MLAAALTAAALWGLAYLVGALPVSYLLARIVGGIDLRRHGSGNLGGSNLAAQLGRRWLPVIVAVDFVRGAGPILLGHYILGLGGHTWDGQPWDWYPRAEHFGDGYPWALAVTPLFTIAGNCWSPFLGFTGGRSVGIWAGGILAMSPALFLAGLAAYLAGWLLTRRSAECLLAMMVILPAAAALLPAPVDPSHSLPPAAFPSDTLPTVAFPWDTLLPAALLAPPFLMASFLADGAAPLAVFIAAGGALILLKRLTSNGEPLPENLPRSSVLVNRLLRDRDIADRQQWVSRTPEPTSITEAD